VKRLVEMRRPEFLALRQGVFKQEAERAQPRFSQARLSQRDCAARASSGTPGQDRPFAATLRATASASVAAQLLAGSFSAISRVSSTTVSMAPNARVLRVTPSSMRRWMRL
jgi:hypothetical protein